MALIKPQTNSLVQEFKVVSLRDHTVLTDDKANVRYSAPDYWRTYIVTGPHFNPDVEQLVVLMLNTNLMIFGHHLVAMGTLNSCPFHPREAFRAAIISNAFAITLMHNHPSGTLTPSDGDIQVTKSAVRAGQMMQIKVYDHYIMGARQKVGRRWLDHTSMKRLGLGYLE